MPKIIQNKVNDAKLTVDGITTSNTTADGLTLSINGTVTSSDAIHAKIDGFNASMYLEDKLPHTPFLQLEMPNTETGAWPVNVTQHVSLSDNATRNAFIDYNKWLMANKTTRVTVSGVTYVHVKALKAHKVNFKKTITMNG